MAPLLRDASFSFLIGMPLMGLSCEPDNLTLDDHITRRGGGKGTGYTRIYELLFGPRRCRVKAVLEIGVGSTQADLPCNMHFTASKWDPGIPPYSPGGSLRAYRDYFPKAHIIGIDLDPKLKRISEPRIAVHAGNSMVQEHVDEILRAELPRKGPKEFLSIVIDDGCHGTLCQRATLHNVWPYLEVGGLYVIEDVWRDSVQPLILELSSRGVLSLSASASSLNPIHNVLVFVKSAIREVAVPAHELLTEKHLPAGYRECWSGYRQVNSIPSRQGDLRM